MAPRSSSIHAKLRCCSLRSALPTRFVAAGLLHDTIERTATTPFDLRRRFGTEVTALVAAVTEQPSIRSYRQRKAALRERATTSGEPAAILFAADKISKVREYREQLARSLRGGDHPRQRRLHHYTESLVSLEAGIPHHPLVRTLRTELAQLTPLPAAGGVTTVAIATRSTPDPVSVNLLQIDPFGASIDALVMKGPRFESGRRLHRHYPDPRRNHGFNGISCSESESLERAAL